MTLSAFGSRGKGRDDAGRVQCGGDTQFVMSMDVDWLRGNPHFDIGHKAIPHLEYSGILKLELFLRGAEKFLSGIGRITHSLGKPVKEKEVGKPNIGNIPKWR